MAGRRVLGGLALLLSLGFLVAVAINGPFMVEPPTADRSAD
jgi:hypothetical protein